MEAQGPYQLVFDLMNRGYTTWHIALIPAAIAIAALIFRRLCTLGPTLEEQRNSRVYRFVLALASICAGAMAALVVFGTREEYEALRAAVANGDYRTVTGTVTDFRPEGPDGHPGEQFRVDTVTYNYSTYVITPGFHRTLPHGGPVREGERVRIHDVNGTIVRLEIAR